MDTQDDLPNCTRKREGDSSYVSTENSVYLCINESWRYLGEVADNEDVLPNCTENRNGERAFLVDDHVTLLCSGNKWSPYDIYKGIEPEEVRISSSSSENSLLMDSRDGQTYKTVKMGDQWWMAENLNYALLQPTEDLDSSSFCQRDSLEYCDIFGRLYLKSAAMDSAGTWSDGGLKCGYYSDCSPKEPVRGVCPEGWHLPNDDEWEALFAVVGDSSLVPLALKSSTLWDKIDGGVDAFGFAVLPAGCRRGLGDYYSIGYSTSYWSATEDSRASSKTIDFFRNEGYDYMHRGYKNYAHPVRCVMDS